MVDNNRSKQHSSYNYRSVLELHTKFDIEKGPAAANVYLRNSEEQQIARLTIDWSYDGIYFRVDGDTQDIVLSIGPQTKKNQLELIDSPEKRFLFKKLGNYALERLQGYSSNSDKALQELQKILFLF